MFNYSRVVRPDPQSYENRREALLKKCRGDVVKTTEYFDVHTDVILTRAYLLRAETELHPAKEPEAEDFFKRTMGRDADRF